MAFRQRLDKGMTGVKLIISIQCFYCYGQVNMLGAVTMTAVLTIESVFVGGLWVFLKLSAGNINGIPLPMKIGILMGCVRVENHTHCLRTY